jgi:import inner membrane translocase subunit TIM23
MKQGSATANTLGVLAVMYSGFGVLLSWGRGSDDELNTLTAATATGLLYKSTGECAAKSISDNGPFKAFLDHAAFTQLINKSAAFMEPKEYVASETLINVINSLWYG